MFSLYHSLQKQFIILSHAVLVASNLAWSMHICLRLYRALSVGIRLDVTQHLCFQATIFGALSCFIHERLICEIIFTRWITSKSRATSLANITEPQMQKYWKIEKKKSKNQDTRAIFSAFHFADKLFAYEYVTWRFSNAHYGLAF